MDEIEKFNLIEKLIRVNYNNNYYEQMFENDPLEINDLELIKNRNQVKIRNKKLTMDNVLSNSYKDPKNYIVRNIKKPTNIYDFNYKLKVTLLEKDVEMQKKFMKDSSPYKKKTNNSNNKNITIYNNNNFIYSNNNTNNNNNNLINFNYDEKYFTNTNISITNQTNFIKETINSILDESISTNKYKNKKINNENNFYIENSSNKKLENNDRENENFFNEENKNINFYLDELNDTNLKYIKYQELHSTNKGQKYIRQSNKNIKNVDNSHDIFSTIENEDYNNKNVVVNNSQKNISRNKYPDNDESSIFDIKSDIKILENKNKNFKSNKKLIKQEKNINIWKGGIKNKNNKKNSKRNSFDSKTKLGLEEINNIKQKILLNSNININLDKINKNSLIHNMYDINNVDIIKKKYMKNYETLEKNNIIQGSVCDTILESNKKRLSQIEDMKENENKSSMESTSQVFIDDDKIQKLDDSGILKPNKYESVYFKSIKKIEEESSMPKIAKISLNENYLIDMESQNKTKNEIEKIKNKIKDTLKRRFDFSDEYLNDLHKKLQKKIINVDRNYENVKNKYEQYKQQKILGKKDHETAMKLHVMNRNPILQINNMVSFPMIINDPMLLASIYNVNMYNLEYTSNQMN